MLCSCRSVAQSCPTLCDPMDCSPPVSMGFSRQEYCRGLPFPAPGDLPNAGIETGSPVLQADALPSEPVDIHFLSCTGRILAPRSSCAAGGGHPGQDTVRTRPAPRVLCRAALSEGAPGERSPGLPAHAGLSPFPACPPTTLPVVPGTFSQIKDLQPTPCLKV